jgi:hypothetical protein
MASSGGRLTTRWSRPGQPGVKFGAILAVAGRAAHLEAVRPPIALAVEYERILAEFIKQRIGESLSDKYFITSNRLLSTNHVPR